MTKTSLRKKVKELIRHSLNSKRVDKIIDSIVRENKDRVVDAEDNYRLPRNIVCAISKQLYADYQPLADNRVDRREIERYYNSIWYV